MPAPETNSSSRILLTVAFVIGAIILVAILLLIIRARDTVVPGAPPAITGSVTPTPDRSTTPTRTPTPTPEGAASAGGYVKLTTLADSGTGRSETVAVRGTRVRVTYDCSGTGCGASLYRTGQEQPVKVIISNQDRANGTTTVDVTPGDYYLTADSTSGSYTISLEDSR